MTIRKGEEWGIRIIAPDLLDLLPDDAHLARLDSHAIGTLAGGDIHYTLGSPAPVTPGSECTQLEIDALHVTVTTSLGDDVEILAASRVEVGQLRPKIFTRQRYWCVTNGGVIDGRNLAPRAHPNDGVLDCVEIAEEMPFRDRMTAVKKAISGTHIPHPHIRVSRNESFACLRGDRRLELFIDGRRIPDWLAVTVNVLPDYWKIVV